MRDGMPSGSRTLEAALIAVGFEEAAAAFDAATDGAAEPLADLVTAYRAFVRRHPQAVPAHDGRAAAP
jgi:hypothetical protein